jgi:hypothetical protein
MLSREEKLKELERLALAGGPAPSSMLAMASRTGEGSSYARGPTGASVQVILYQGATCVAGPDPTVTTANRTKVTARRVA